MFYIKYAVIAVLSLSVHAFAQNVDSLKIDFNQTTGEVKYQINGGEWVSAVDQAAVENDPSALVEKVGYAYPDEPGYGYGGGCNCGQRYYTGQPGYIQPGYQPGYYPQPGYPPAVITPPPAPVVVQQPPSEVYHRDEETHVIHEYKNVAPTAPVYYGPGGGYPPPAYGPGYQPGYGQPGAGYPPPQGGHPQPPVPAPHH
jgi:hypothetical protein